jgi:hypothetical protein
MPLTYDQIMIEAYKLGIVTPEFILAMKMVFNRE